MTPKPEGRDERILAALRAAAPGVVSGETLATELGVSRVAVGKRIAGLREVGYAIDAAAGAGYRLLQAPDLPLPAEVRPLLRSAFWTRLSGGGTTGSTNDDAKELARAGAGEGTVVLAAEQTAGRGRLGREWTSPPGGAYLSAILRPRLAPADVPPLALVAGVGLARGLASLGVDVSLKWPNDVLIGEGKVAGVLLEMSAEADCIEWVVVGCGINVRRPERPLPGAVHLEDAVTPSAEALRLAEVAAAALDGIAAAYGEFLAGGFPALSAEYATRDALLGREVTVRDADGPARVTGIVARVDTSGRLIIRSENGEVALSAGEVTLRSE